MDRTTFADTGSESKWWLLEPEIDYSMVELRRDLSESLGYARDDEWYKEQSKLESLYDRLEQHDRTLLTDLDAADDNDKRKVWLESVLSALEPEKDEVPAESPASDAATAAPVASAAAAAPAKKRSGIFAKKDDQHPAGDAPSMDASEAVKVVMNGLDDQRVAQLATELQMAPDEVRALLAQLPEGFEEEVAAEARTIAAQAS